MMSRLSMSRQLMTSLRQVRQPIRRMCCKDDDYQSPHMNDLPLPAGSWKEDYDRRNRKYNIFLALSIISFIGTVFVGESMELLYWNYSVPRLD